MSLIFRQYIIGFDCDILNLQSKETALSYLRQRYYNGTCLDMHTRWLQAELLEDDNKAWIYQQCSGLGWMPNTGSRKQPFGTQLPVQIFYEVCERIFGNKLETYAIDNGEL